MRLRDLERFRETLKLCVQPQLMIIPTPESSGFAFNWTTMNVDRLNYLSITDSPEMEVGFRWQGHVFWNWYARHLDAVDVGNLQRIAQLDKQLGDYQVLVSLPLLLSLSKFRCSVKNKVNNL
uniref:Creatinase_N domain-containing protein n=1 Tax=Ascaris lumbricoides TaxID=6252 RepID=A0A0M3HG11_ASCLU